MILSLLGLVISCIPSIFLYVYLRNLRKDDPGYLSECRCLLRNGILCSFGVAALALAVNIIWSISGPGRDMPLFRAAFKAFILAALTEELVKYLTADKVIKKNAGSVSWLDCIAYSAVVGIGFQLIETVVYMLESNVGQILIRGFTMGHPAYGMLMGYYTGKALYTGKRSFRVFAFVCPFLIHGLYDFSLAEEFQALNDNLVFVPFIMVLIEMIVLIRILLLIRKERNGTKYTDRIA